MLPLFIYTNMIIQLNDSFDNRRCCIEKMAFMYQESWNQNFLISFCGIFLSIDFGFFWSFKRVSYLYEYVEWKKECKIVSKMCNNQILFVIFFEQINISCHTVSLLIFTQTLFTFSWDNLEKCMFHFPRLTYHD